MNANQLINSRVGGYLALGCVGLAVAWYISKKIPSVQSAVNAVSPLNNDNIFKQGVDAVGGGVVGDSDWTLGGAIYDFFHTEYDPNVAGSGGVDWEGIAESVNPIAWAGGKVADTFSNIDWPDLNFDYINPASDKNIIYTGVNKVGSAASGDSSFSLGSWLYDVFNPEPKPKTTVKADSTWLDWNFNNEESINE